jgi:hypothetical protein
MTNLRWVQIYLAQGIKFDEPGRLLAQSFPKPRLRVLQIKSSLTSIASQHELTFNLGAVPLYTTSWSETILSSTTPIVFEIFVHKGAEKWRYSEQIRTSSQASCWNERIEIKGNW